MDILSDELSRAHADGAVFSVLRRLEPWGLQFSGTRPLTAHLLLEGSGWLLAEGIEPIPIHAHDMVLATAGSRYSVVSSPDAISVPIADARAIGAESALTGATSATIMCGAYVMAGSVGEALLDGLPRFAIIRADEQEPAQRAAVKLLADEAIKGTPGQQALLDRLLDVNLVYSLRTWWNLSDMAPGWYRALSHPSLRRVLEAIHARPDREWTLETMSREAQMSRASFAAQFSRIVGLPPRRYVTQLRMSRSEDALTRTHETLASISVAVGYGSEYAFATAFRRTHGISPGAWRTQRRGRVDDRGR